jgi:CheY-like chemotaxis protein
MSAPGDQSSRVLVVEDDLALRDTLAAVLRFAGYDVVTAENGLEALELLDGHLPVLILLDIAMPVMDGHAFRAEQLLDPGLTAIPIIVLTAEHDIDEPLRAIRPDALLRKPFDLDVLLATVAAVKRKPEMNGC